MNKLFFIFITICTIPNLSGQNYVIALKHLDAKNIATLLNMIINDSSITCAANPEKSEIIISANNEDYLIIQKLVSEWDQPLP